MSINRSLHRIAQEGVIQTLEEKDKEIERLKKRIKELEEGFKATTEDLCEESTKISKAIEYIENNSEKVELNFVGFPESITSFKGKVPTLLKILKGEE